MSSLRPLATYPSRRPRLWLVLAGVLILIGAGWILWAGLYHAHPTVAGRVDSFEVLDDTQVRVSLTVDRSDPSVPATCHVITQSVNYQQVGELDVQVGPGSQRLELVTVTVRTISRATSASLSGCEDAS